MTVQTNKHIHAAVERLIASQGEYRPLELLLALGRLSYTHYDAWRAGGMGWLEEGLVGLPGRNIQILRAAAEWAEMLGLTPREEAYCTGSGTVRELRLFRDPAIDRLARTHYHRQNCAPQLDLFFDSGVTGALNDLCAALVARDEGEAERQLSLLSEADPGHRLLVAAETLVDALGHLGRPVDDPAEELAATEGRLVSRAEELLGSRARDYLAPFWGRLAAALPPERFDPAQERLHPSWIAAQYMDWAAVAAAVEAVPDYSRQPILLARLAEARLLSGDHAPGLAAACRLCWCAPDQAEAWIDHTVDDTLANAWERFWDLEADLSMAWFPAWLLIAEPGLGHHLPERLGEEHGDPGRAFAVVHRLQRQGDSMELRAALKALSGVLFQAWLVHSSR